MIRAKDYDISVIVPCYNPNIEKLKMTLRSILLQEGVCFQIVLADDGSIEDYFPAIEAFFEVEGFEDYKFVTSEKNNGTTINFYQGVRAADSDYIKGISPGDFLYSQDTLRGWLSFVEANRIKASFGDAVFYNADDGHFHVIERRISTRPLIRSIYDIGHLNRRAACRNFIMLNDVVLGAAMLFEKETVLEYCKKLTGRIKYCEDKMTGLMLLDGIEVVRYPHSILLYEFGNGISTEKNDHWRRVLDADEDAFLQILKNQGARDALARRCCKYLMEVREHGDDNIVLMCKYPDVFMARLLRKFRIWTGGTKTPTKVDEGFIQRIRGRS